MTSIGKRFWRKGVSLHSKLEPHPKMEYDVLRSKNFHQKMVGRYVTQDDADAEWTEPRTSLAASAARLRRGRGVTAVASVGPINKSPRSWMKDA